MNFAIEFNRSNTDYLNVTPRKKTLKHQLMIVKQGLVLVRLGKQEICVEPGKAFWLPQGCLTSISTFPNSQVDYLNFSLRVAAPLPTKAGFVKLNELLMAILDRLVETDTQSDQQKELFAVALRDMQFLAPTLNNSKSTQDFTLWTIDSRQLTREHHLIMLVREARKQKLSGKKIEEIAENFFGGNLEQLQQVCQLVLGTEL